MRSDSRGDATDPPEPAGGKSPLESPDLLLCILEASLSGVLIYQSVRDAAGAVIDFRCLLANPAAVRASGHPASDYIGLLLSEIYPQSWQVGFFDRFVETVETGEPQVFEQCFERDGKVRWIRASLVKIADGLALIYDDITSNRLAHEALLRLTQAQNDFISTVSHELRTPLTSIRGSLALLSADVPGALPEPLRPLIDIALRNTERLLTLINDLLDIQRIESASLDLDLQDVELSPVVVEALEDNQAFGAQFGVSFRLSASETGLHVLGDPRRLLQLMANLLSNAAKFSPAGGVVEITVERRDTRARVAVHDHGPGIPDDFQPRIFTRFAQADSSTTRQKGGTGLGLSICKALIEHMGGTIGFTTTTAPSPGHGTTFHFELPLLAAPVERV